MRRKRLLFLVALLVIGFATVSATLVINGVTLIASNEQDFQIFFSEAILDDADKSNTVIKDNKQLIDFETNELTLVGDTSTLDYEVTNNSRQYDAKVEIKCTAKSPEILDYIDLEYSIEKEIIPAKERTRGKVKATLKKPYTGDEEFDKTLACEIGANALEKETANETILENHEYYTYGYLLNDDLPLENKVIGIVSQNSKNFTTTDGRGMFIISGLVGGDYEFLVFNNKTEEELSSLTYEELTNLADEKTEFNTVNGKITLTNLEIRDSKITSGAPTTHTITFDTTGGTTGTFTSTLIEGEKVGFLPTEIDHETLAFVDWQENGTTVNESNTYNEDITLNANFGEGVAKIGEKQFRSLNSAFKYITNADETTIDIIKQNTIPKDIKTDKNIILNLNSLAVNFGEHKITNSGTLTIKNGTINASGLNTFTNLETLNLEENFNLIYENNTNESKKINIIVNNKNLNINNSSITASQQSRSSGHSVIKNLGTTIIDNSNIDTNNTQFSTSKDSITTLNNSTINCQGDKNGEYFFEVSGTLNYNDTTFATKETNLKVRGLLNGREGSTINLNSGTVNNTYGDDYTVTTSKSSTINIGQDGKTLDIIGNGEGYVTLKTNGDINIKAGTINTSGGFGYEVNGKLTIGSETETPTLNHEDARHLLRIESDADNRIINGNINTYNTYAINVTPTGKLTIDNINLIQTTSTSTNSAINVSGNLIINNGSYRIAETNQKSHGILGVNATGIATINAGVFDNTYGTAATIYNAAGSTLNMGQAEKIIDLYGNDSESHTIMSSGNLNIKEGTINTTNGTGYIINGKMTIGTENTTPTFNHVSTHRLMSVYSNEDNKIINANINVKLTTNKTISRAIYIAGNLTIDNGIFKVNEGNLGAEGLVEVDKTGIATINGGVFDNTYGTSNSFYGFENTTLNLGKEGKTVNIIGNDTNNYTVFSTGNINIPTGTITFENGYGLGISGLLTIGSETSSPTIIGKTFRKNVVSINSTQENIIKNACFKITDSTGIAVNKTGKLTIDDADIDFSHTLSAHRIFHVSGKLTINDGTYVVSSSNTKGGGIMQVNDGGTANINGGNFEGSYAKGNSVYTYAGSTLNIGQEGKTVDFIGNGSTTYTIAAYGNLNINEGIINTSNGPGYGIFGKLNMGLESTIPTLNHTGTATMLAIRSNSENKIINGNVNITNAETLRVHANSKLTIDNINLRQTANTRTIRTIYVSGNLTINNADMKVGGQSLGLFDFYDNSSTSINGGSYLYSPEGAVNNAVFVHPNATVNFGNASTDGPSIISTSSETFPLISNHGELNIYSGNYQIDKATVLVQIISDENNETDEEKLNYASVTNIYGGSVKNNSSGHPTIRIYAGKLNMSGGEIINDGGGRTIHNSTGTAIQTGGTSANNYGVTVQ